MASLKAEKPVGSQQAKEPAKTTTCTAPKAPASKPAPKKAAPKTQEPKKKVVVIHTHMCACFFYTPTDKNFIKTNRNTNCGESKRFRLYSNQIHEQKWSNTYTSKTISLLIWLVSRWF